MKGIGFLGLVLLLVACSGGQIDYPKREIPQQLLGSLEAQRAGQQLFLDNCAFCHGHVEEGRSLRANDYDPPPMDFSDPQYHSVDPAYLYWRIAEGKNVEPFRSRGSVMPAWGAHYTEEQIWQLVAYIRARSR